MKSKLLLILSLVAGTTLFSFSTAGAQITSLTQDLAACWDLNESSGTRSDFWNNNDLTDFNTVTANPGHVNTQAGQFTAANTEYLHAADSADFAFTGDVTVGAWVYFDSLGGVQHIINNDTNIGTDPVFDLRQHTGSIWQFRIKDGLGGIVLCGSSAGAASTGQWYLAMGWTDHGNTDCYTSIDNANTTSTNTGSTYPASSNSGGVWIGSYASTIQFMDGRIGPAFMWTRILTVSERDWLWNGGAGRGCSEITGLTADRAYSQDVIDLPNGRRGAVEMRLSAGEIAISTGVLGLLILAIFWIMRDTVRSSKVGDK